MLAEIEVKTRQLLSDAISENTDLGYYRIQKLIKARSVKINGVRVGADMNVNAGDTVHVYFADREKNSIEVVYRDDNILVVNKASGIEVQGTDSLTERINNLLTDVVAAPVHRLDRNTMGLVVFALFPYVVYVLRDLLDIEMPVNLVFLLMFCFVLVVLLSLSIAISQLADKCKRLTQANAILEKRVRDLEQQQKH